MKNLFSLVIFFLSLNTFAAGNTISMTLFKNGPCNQTSTQNNCILAEKSFALPLSAADALEVESGSVRCEAGAIARVSLNDPNPLHLTLSDKKLNTSFNGDVFFGRQLYLSLQDEYFCMIEIK